MTRIIGFVLWLWLGPLATVTWGFGLGMISIAFGARGIYAFGFAVLGAIIGMWITILAEEMFL